MSRDLLLLAIVALLPTGCASPTAHGNAADSKLAAAPDVANASDDEKTLYIIGVALGRSTTSLDLTADELRFVEAGIEDQVAGRAARVPIDTYAPKVEELHKRRAAASVAKREAEGKAAIAAAAQEPGAIKSESGLVFRTLKPGTGETPKTTDKVKVHYRGSFPGGKLFDSSLAGESVELSVAGVIPCWSEALKRMKVGERAQVVCPPELAYGDHGNPPTMPGHATLIFEIELVSCESGIVEPGKAEPVDGTGP